MRGCCGVRRIEMRSATTYRMEGATAWLLGLPGVIGYCVLMVMANRADVFQDLPNAAYGAIFVGGVLGVAIATMYAGECLESWWYGDNRR